MSSSSGAVVVCILLTMQTFCTEAVHPYIQQGSGSNRMQSNQWQPPLYPQNLPSLYPTLYDPSIGADLQSMPAMHPYIQQGSGSNRMQSNQWQPPLYPQNLQQNLYPTNAPFTGENPQLMRAVHPYIQQGSGSNRMQSNQWQPPLYPQNFQNFYPTNAPFTGANPQLMRPMNMNNRQESGLTRMDSNQWGQKNHGQWTGNQQLPNKQFLTNQQNPSQTYQIPDTNSYYPSPQSRPTVSTRPEVETWNLQPKGPADQFSPQMNGNGNDMTGMMNGILLQTIQKQVGALLLNFFATFDPNQCERLQSLIAGMRPSTREKIANVVTIVKSLLEDSLGGATHFNIPVEPTIMEDIQPQSFVPDGTQATVSSGNQQPIRNDPANAVNVPESLSPIDIQPQSLVPDDTQATVSSDNQQSFGNNPTNSANVDIPLILNEKNDNAGQLEQLATAVLNKGKSQGASTQASVLTKPQLKIRPQVTPIATQNRIISLSNN